jgi:hypothetical protein
MHFTNDKTLLSTKSHIDQDIDKTHNDINTKIIILTKPLYYYQYSFQHCLTLSKYSEANFPKVS